MSDVDPAGLVKTLDHDLNAGTPEIKKIKSDFSNPFGYHGMWRDEHTGLYHTHYRLYDPQHVRWLTPDPAGYADGSNLYRFYAGPNGVDVLGLNISDEDDRFLMEQYKKIIKLISRFKFDEAIKGYENLIEMMATLDNDGFWGSLSESGDHGSVWERRLKRDMNMDSFANPFAEAIKRTSRTGCWDYENEYFNNEFEYQSIQGIIETDDIVNIMFLGGGKVIRVGGSLFLKTVTTAGIKMVAMNTLMKEGLKQYVQNYFKKQFLANKSVLAIMNVSMADFAGFGLNAARGLSDDAISYAFKSPRFAHAIRHYVEQGLVIGSMNSKVALENSRKLLTNILSSPTKTFDYVLGGAKVKGFYKVVDGRDVVAFVAKEQTGRVAAGQVLGTWSPSLAKNPDIMRLIKW